MTNGVNSLTPAQVLSPGGASEGLRNRLEDKISVELVIYEGSIRAQKEAFNTLYGSPEEWEYGLNFRGDDEPPEIEQVGDVIEKSLALMAASIELESKLLSTAVGGEIQPAVKMDIETRRMIQTLERARGQLRMPGEPGFVDGDKAIRNVMDALENESLARAEALTNTHRKFPGILEKLPLVGSKIAEHNASQEFYRRRIGERQARRAAAVREMFEGHLQARLDAGAKIEQSRGSGLY